MAMKIAVLTGGGDCPGLNGAIKWVTKTALDPHLEAKRSVKFDVIGIKDGWKGLGRLIRIVPQASPVIL
jgi:6-phosphofructokinase